MSQRQRFVIKRRALSRAVIATLLAGSAVGASANSYSNLFVFGDSLSDAGVYAPLVGPNARFTTNPGTVWAENLGAAYGKPVSTAYLAGTTGFTLNATGNDFAIGGARVNAVPGVLTGALTPLAAVLPPVADQVTGYLARGPVDPDALVAVWAGANDIFAQMSAVGAGGSVAAAQAATIAAATDLSTQIGRLQAAGARNMIVISVPDIGKTPFGASGGANQAALASGLTTAYDTVLAARLAGRNLLYFDGVKLFAAILQNPTAYGFTNTTVPACGTASSLGCVPGAAANGALFADGVHPSSAAHRVISDWVHSSLEATGRAGAMAAAPLARGAQQWRLSDARMQEFQNFGYKGQGFFASGDYTSTRVDGTANQASADGSGGNLTVGYEAAFNENLFAGLTLGYAHLPLDLGNGQGSVKYDEWALSAFFSHKMGALYANASASYSRLDFSSRRDIALGPFNTSESGDTRGDSLGAKAQVGYNFGGGALVHGPLAALSWQRVGVDAFSENSGAPTALAFTRQVRESLRSRLGWQIAADQTWSGVHVRPYAQLAYETEHKKDNRSYSAGFVGSTSAMEVATANRTGGYGVLQAGVNAELSKTLRLGVSASTTLSQPGSRGSAVGVTLSAAL